LYINSKGILCFDAQINRVIDPVSVVWNNRLEFLPNDWDCNQSESAFEIVDENRTPVYQIQFKTPTLVCVNGVFSADGQVVYQGNYNNVLKTMGRYMFCPEVQNSGPPIQRYPIPTKAIFKYPSYKFPGVYSD